MKLCKVLMLLWVAVAPLSFAAEVLEALKTRGGREYFKVEVLTNDDVGIRIRHEAGTARIPYEDLPDALQSKYRAEKKKAALIKIEATNAEQERIRHEQEKSEQALSEEKAKSSAKPRPQPALTKPDAESDFEAPAENKEVVKLEAYITQMKETAKAAAAEASRLRTQDSGQRAAIKNASRAQRL